MSAAAQNNHIDIISPAEQEVRRALARRPCLRQPLLVAVAAPTVAPGSPGIEAYRKALTYDKAPAKKGKKKRPRKKIGIGRRDMKRLTLKDDGKTDNPMRLWSGGLLIDNVAGEARKMTVERVEGREHLFVEEGGFGPDKKEGWKCRLYVTVRTK